MSTYPADFRQQFADRLKEWFPMTDAVEIICSWTVSYSEMAKIAEQRMAQAGT